MTADPATRTLRVLVVEDDRGLRRSLELLLDSSPGFRCAASAPSAEEGLLAFGRDVDLVLLDVNLPGRPGSEAVASFRERRPTVPVVMLTVQEDAEVIFRALCNGASGYLLKRTPPAELLAALAEAGAGGAPMSPEVARKVVGYFHALPPPSPPEAPLSPQETRLLRLLVDGATYQKAADEMGISVNTVRNHVRSIYEKLHVHSKSEAVGKALKSRLV